MKKAIIILFFLILPSIGISQEADLEAVTQTVNLYFEGMMERNAAKLNEAFLPNA